MRRLVLFCFVPFLAYALPYEVRFIGLHDEKALQALIEHSELVSQQRRPPASINGLQYRAAADIPNLIKVLHAYAYYGAQISFKVENCEELARVDVFIQPGSQFLLKSYEVSTGDCLKPENVPGCCPFTPLQLGISLDSPALSTQIVSGEESVLNELSRCGYPLASIRTRNVEVDMEESSVKAETCVQTGPFAKFGSTTFCGIENINPAFIQNKVSWKEGCPYNSDLVLDTQKRLLNTELFSSVMISHEDTLDENGSLPLNLSITEARHKKITLGAFYATVNGFGGNITWTNRNFRGMGEIISLKAEYAQKSYEGNITYKKPDFLRFDQTYKALLEVSHEDIHPYHSLLYRFANYIDRPLPPHAFFSAGLKLDHIQVTDSAENGTYFVLGLPFFWKYDKADNPMDPKRGYTFVYSGTPYQSLRDASVQFVKQRLTGTCYIPIAPNQKIVLALRAQIGSIAGAKQKDVPMTKLFFGGSEDDLRGYKYQTVSPLRGHKPLGGRSAVFSSVELRFRIMEKIGVVPFADFGTVALSEAPELDAKWFKSVGLGLRYFAFFGPLRFDIGFPLDKRKHIDSNFQIYASVGQSF